MTRRRVVYVIDHQRPGRDRWLKAETMTASVESSRDEAAQELAERFELTTVPVAREGCRVRARVWPGRDDLFAFDPDIEPADSIWIYDPKETAHGDLRR